MVRRFMIALVLGAGTLLAPGRAAADDRWLETPLASWNQAGMGVPTATGGVADVGVNDPFCNRSIRPPETAADFEVTAAGWSLVGSYEGGWGIVAVTGTTGFDGMCRPIGYQVFVFADGVFAGTISPEPMASRTSGAGSLSRLSGGQLFATFVRYTETDPLCCPSRPSALVEYEISRTDDGPVLVPTRVFAGS